MRIYIIHLLLLLLPVISFAEISIGIIAPMTGNQSQIGEAINNGIMLAKSDNPALFKDINIVIEDSQFSNRVAVSSLKKLVEIDKVKLVYVFGHGQSHTLAPIAERYKVPLVACTGEKDIEKNRESVIRFFVPHEFLGFILFKHLESKGYKKLAMIKTELSFIENIFKGLKSNLPKDMSLEVIESHPSAETDFRTSIAKAKLKKADALGVFLGQGQIAPFYNQLKQLKFNTPTFGTHAFESSEEISNAGNNINGAVLPALTSSLEFGIRYNKKYGNETFIAFAANAYDFITLSAKLTSENNTAKSLVKAFKDVKNGKGAGGEFDYQDSKEFGSGYIFPVAMKEIRNGEIVELEVF